MMQTMKKYYWPALLLCAIAMGSFLRIWQITSSDVITDEGGLGFRPVGLIDFDAAENQTTPWEWTGTPYWWMRLSMHDHPPLYFLAQHLSFTILGENTIAMRLPSAIFGIGSLILVYFITKKLFDKWTAVITVALASVQAYLVWVSRTGLQESMVIFFMLASVLAFIHSEKNNRLFFAFGLFLGLSWLTKYTAIALLPAVFAYIIVARKNFLKSKYLWMALAISVIIFSPVILYNIMLFRKFGHFDFQFSYLFGQNVSAWQIQPGKEEFKNFNEKFFALFSNLKNGLTPAFLTGLLLSFVYSSYISLRKRSQAAFLPIFTIFSLFAMYIFIGPSQRFLSIVIPFFIMILSYGTRQLTDFIKKFPKRKLWMAFYALAIIFFIATEGYFSYQTAISKKPKNYYSKNLQSNFSYSGYNELNSWIEEKIRNKGPQYSFTMQYEFLQKLSEKKLKKNNNLAPILFVYDENINEESNLWIFHRQMAYHSWPVLTSEAYYKTIFDKGKDFYKKTGLSEIYFIKKSPNTMGKKFGNTSKFPDILSNYLNIGENSNQNDLRDPFGNIAFSIYAL